MKGKINKLKEIVQGLYDEVKNKTRSNTTPVQYWNGADWQNKAVEEAYFNVLKEIDKLNNSKCNTESRHLNI